MKVSLHLCKLSFSFMNKMYATPIMSPSNYPEEVIWLNMTQIRKITYKVMVKFIHVYYYFVGAFGIIWYIVWHFLSYPTPAQCPTITEAERTYIETTLKENTSNVSNKVKSYHKVHTNDNSEIISCLRCIGDLHRHLSTVKHSYHT